MFTTGAARWLAVEPGVPAAVEPARILLVGVPYALKAADADTLGGRPASAYLTTDSQPAPTGSAPAVTAAPVITPAVTPATSPTGGGTTDYVPLWAFSTNLGDSILFQSGSIMEVNGTLELRSLGTATTSIGYDSQPFDLFASAYNSSSKAAVAQDFRREAEPVSNDTSAPAGKVDLLYASGTGTPADDRTFNKQRRRADVCIRADFFGHGAGDDYGRDGGNRLTGGGTSGKVTLNLDTTKVPQLNASNAFTGNQSVTGNIRFLPSSADAATLPQKPNRAGRFWWINSAPPLFLDCVNREYPNKIAHVLHSDADARPPRLLTPAFYGCYDWHSAVHGHWLLANEHFAACAHRTLNKNLTARNIAAEAQYIGNEERASFERPYGLVWLLTLGAELRLFDAELARILMPLEIVAVDRLRDWIPKLPYPDRSGQHSNTAFALGLALDWARAVKDN